MISAYIDRFEGELAVLLLGDAMKKVNFPKQFLPPEVHEGDYLKIDIAFDAEIGRASCRERVSSPV